MPFDENSLAGLIAETDAGIVHSPAWYSQLKEAIDHLLDQDFNRLVQVLYQADVPEHTLKQLLKDNPATDASAIIARLLLQRQLQKIEARKLFSLKPNEGDTEERW